MQRRIFAVASFASGFAVMGAEVAAGRLLAPAFGTSTMVWSALIGCVLGALAAGSMLGGRWSRRPSALREMFATTALAGVFLAVLPALARPLLRTAFEHFLQGRLVVLGLAFVAVMTMIVVPVLLLGAMSPLLIHHATGERSEVGRTSGRLGAVGTIGSLAGTFLCGVVLVPLAGTEATFRICGGLTLVVGAIGYGLLARPSVRRAVAAGVTVTAVLASASAPRGEKSGALYEAESAYNFIRVVDRSNQRLLYLNEGYAKQTVARLDGEPYLRGVWGYYAMAPTLTQATPSRILVLGLGGGTSARGYVERLPNAEVVAVELDPGVVKVAREYFGLPASVEVHVEDARAFLARDTRSYDLVVVDAFQFPYVPFQLTTREFFEDVRRHLKDGGAVMVNAGRKGSHLDVVHAVASTMATAFPFVSGANVGQATNTILVGTAHDLSERGGANGVAFSESERAELRALAPLVPWTVPPSQQLVLTDDAAPVEWLTNRIVLRELFGS